ncbi:MAG: AraC family transcriptional regulator [Defluviitaleaceae bacterium]|nr:AraC family transcriptional regulator [Defluviitaleaceae bacterium]MCL2275276.1 AraC family transcriptional regulator [Defluviitaleaceae bacterium]
MDWLSRMNAAMTYIEDNLDGEINYDELARIACCSAHSFFRMFSFIMDISLSEYVRRRRLTLAALALRDSGVRVIDVALRFGYDSPVSFSRAFALLHGVTPKQARAGGVTLKAFPRISFQISIKGEKEMDYRIETKEAFQVFGIEEIFPAESVLNTDMSGGDKKLRQPADLWEDCHANGAYEKLDAAAGKLPPFVNPALNNVHAVCDYRETEKDTFPYMLCAFKTADSNPAGYTVVDIPAHTWAIFPTEKFGWDDCGKVLGGLYKRIFSEWLPTSSYEQVGSLDMELYGGDDDFGYVEIWLAIRKKG